MKGRRLAEMYGASMFAMLLYAGNVGVNYMKKKILILVGVATILLILSFQIYNFWKIRRIEKMLTVVVTDWKNNLNAPFKQWESINEEMSKTIDLINSKTEINMVQGQWFLNRIGKYPSLSFLNKENLIIYNHSDTFLHFNYFLLKDTLIIENRYNETKIISIRKLSRDTLIFESLLDSEVEMVYTRNELTDANTQ